MQAATTPAAANRKKEIKGTSKNPFSMLTIFTKLRAISGRFVRMNKKWMGMFLAFEFRRFYYFKRRSACLQLTAS